MKFYLSYRNVDREYDARGKKIYRTVQLRVRSTHQSLNNSRVPYTVFVHLPSKCTTYRFYKRGVECNWFNLSIVQQSGLLFSCTVPTYFFSCHQCLCFFFFSPTDRSRPSSRLVRSFAPFRFLFEGCVYLIRILKYLEMQTKRC